MLKILLVDDEPLELQALREHVDWEGLGIGRVDTAKNGRAAYEKILEQEPDIVITDVSMPVMDGITLAAKIHELNQRIKVIFLSGYDDFSYVQSALQLGASDYLLKPFTPEDIAKVIRKVKDALNRDLLFSHSLETLEQQLLERLCLEGESQQPVLLEELSRTRQLSSGSDRYGMLAFFSVSGSALPDHLLKNIPSIQAAWMEGDRLGIILRGYADPADAGRRIREQLKNLTGLAYSGVYISGRSLTDRRLRAAWQALKAMEDPVYYQPAGSLSGISPGNAAEEEDSSSSFPFYPPRTFPATFPNPPWRRPWDGWKRCFPMKMTPGPPRRSTACCPKCSACVSPAGLWKTPSGACSCSWNAGSLPAPETPAVFPSPRRSWRAAAARRS